MPRPRSGMGRSGWKECPLYLHGVCARYIEDDIKSCLGRGLVRPQDYLVRGVGESIFPLYVNTLQCGARGVGRMADGSVKLNIFQHRISLPIVIEVAFRNESRRQLLIEGANWVNEFTNTEACVLLKIKENAAQTDVDWFELFVFRRLRGLWSDARIKPTPYCRKEINIADIGTGNQTPVELGRLLELQVVGYFKISRSSLLAGERVLFDLSTMGLNDYYSPLEPFRTEMLTIDLTRCFEDIFAEINGMVRSGTYPGIE